MQVVERQFPRLLGFAPERAGDTVVDERDRPPTHALISPRARSVGRESPHSGGDHGRTAVRGPVSRKRLAELRSAIEALDAELVRLVGERRALVLEVGRLKSELGMPVLDPNREAAVVRRAAALAREAGEDEELVRDVIWRIIAAARYEQEGMTHWGPTTGEDRD